MEQCPANLIDQQWQVTENILNPQHRKRKERIQGQFGCHLKE